MDRTENSLENAADTAKDKVNEYAAKARNYIEEQKRKNEEPTREGFFDNLKSNLADAWEDTKDFADKAWESTKDTANDAWEKTKDAAEDVKAEVRKATN
ncbi:hypothetical protein EIB74_13230 [Epilithonimonas vandammei]|uniref:Uncharacterized protein n=2 Tax=Epilithonimonas TaxID=2782229 RepID=A0A3N0XA32_9FLAO|nr:hypothetical protein EIB74_13230 [Epilithonimonas vandammei]ROI13631.1 hypothetical protein EGH73_07530 [Epilithonimonas hominis]